jgi:hypothetical protein
MATSSPPLASRLTFQLYTTYYLYEQNVLTISGENGDELPAPGLQADRVEKAAAPSGVGDVPELEVRVLVALHLRDVAAQQATVLREVFVVQHRSVVPANTVPVSENTRKIFSLLLLDPSSLFMLSCLLRV